MVYINQKYCVACNKTTSHDLDGACLDCRAKLEDEILNDRLYELSKMSLEQRVTILEGQLNRFLLFDYKPRF